jgi:hypothetical protein
VNLKLTDAFIKGIKSQSKTKSYSDGHGLVLLCNPKGTMGWRYRYRFSGKPKMLSFGTYLEVSLKRAVIAVIMMIPNKVFKKLRI